MADRFPLFNHARTSAVIHDPERAIRDGAERGRFDTRNPKVANSPALVAALESNGRMPVAGRESGVSGMQILLGIIAALLIIGGGALAVLSTATLPVGAIIALIGVGLLAVTVVSFRRRRANIAHISKAWANGWLAFAPARVGGVWISSATQHSSRNYNRDDHVPNNDVRYQYRAVVEVFPTDGSQPFQFTTAEFSAPASHSGVPINLKMMEGPLDQGEPEYSNGWTLARWVYGNQDSATITTDLSKLQIQAALKAVGPR